MFSVIIADDNEIVCQGIKNYIDWESLDAFVAATCSDGEEGYHKACELHPDIIISDVDMPISNGLQMAARLKAEDVDADFIFISGFNDFSYVQQAMDIKAFKYVLKPIIFEDLTNSIRLLCEEKQAKRLQQQQFNDMKKDIETHMTFLRERFYKDLLYRHLQNDEEIKIRMNNLGIDKKDEEFLVVFIKTTPDMQAKVKQIAEPSLALRGGYLVDSIENGLVYLIAASKFAMEDFHRALPIFEQLINEKMDEDISIGVSLSSSNITEIPNLFEMAKRALDRRFYKSDTNIFFYTETEPGLIESSIDLLTLRNDIRIALREGCDAFIDQYYDVTTEDDRYYSMDQNALRTLTFTIVNHVQAELVEQNIRKKYTLEDETSIWESLMQIESIDTLKSWLSNVFDEASIEMAKTENSRYGKIVENIKDIIQSQYYTLKNIEQIVKPLYISPSHANLIFKTITGTSIFDYLTKIKMKEAEKLLSDPSYKIYQVAEEIGYKNYASFVSKFKEYSGLTPKQYRNSARMERG